jgi:hypothetical protein
LIEAAFGDNDQEFQSKLLQSIQYYQEAMKLLLLHRELTEEEGELFQDLIDDFFYMD